MTLLTIFLILSLAMAYSYLVAYGVWNALRLTIEYISRKIAG